MPTPHCSHTTRPQVHYTQLVVSIAKHVVTLKRSRTSPGWHVPLLARTTNAARRALGGLHSALHGKMLLRFTLVLISDTNKLLLGAQTMCTLPLTLARWLVARRGSTTGFDSIPATMVSGNATLSYKRRYRPCRDSHKPCCTQTSFERAKMEMNEIL